MLRLDAIDPVGLCVFMCILSSLSAMTVWSLCKFWAQKARRAARRVPRRKEEADVARRERERPRAHVDEASQPPRGASVGGDAESPSRGPPAIRRRYSEPEPAQPRSRLLPRSGSFDTASATIGSAKARDWQANVPASAPGR